MLRWRDPQTPRPYRVPWYPWTPLVFCLSSLFMLYAGLSYAWSTLSDAYVNTENEARWSIAVAVGVSLGIMIVGVVAQLV